MLIGILQTGEAPAEMRPETGDYPDLFETLLAGRGLTFRRYAVLFDQFPADVHACEGWLITGSRFAAYDDLPWIHRLASFIRDCFAARVPMVGICFGHQLMARAMGGKVEKFAGGWCIGATDYDFHGHRMTLNAWHQDQVTMRPPGAELIATTPGCINAGLRYGDSMLSIQPHPEFSADFVRRLIEVRGRGSVPPAALRNAEARLDAHLDRDEMADRIAAFFRQHATAARPPDHAQSE